MSLFSSPGRRNRPGEAIPDRPAPERPGPDADTLARLEAALGSLAELDRGLIRQLFWDGRRADDLAREWGVSRQAVSKRKQKIMLELRRQVGMPLGELRENFRDFRRPAVADSIEPALYL